MVAELHPIWCRTGPTAASPRGPRNSKPSPQHHHWHSEMETAPLPPATIGKRRGSGGATVLQPCPPPTAVITTPPPTGWRRKLRPQRARHQPDWLQHKSFFPCAVQRQNSSKTYCTLNDLTLLCQASVTVNNYNSCTLYSCTSFSVSGDCQTE